MADIDISPFANSAMDGYAVRSADLAQASGEAPVTLDVIGHEAAGHVFEGAIGACEAVRIMTGARRRGRGSGRRRLAGERWIREREGARCPTCGHHLAGHGTGRTE